MNEMYLKALAAGICFAIYPVLLNRSGLNNFSYLSLAIFTFMVFATVAPFSRSQWSGIGNTNWMMMVGASVISGIGMLFLMSLLSKIAVQQVPQLVTIVTIAQIIGSAVIEAIANKQLTYTKGLGFAVAVIAVILLCKK